MSKTPGRPKRSRLQGAGVVQTRRSAPGHFSSDGWNASDWYLGMAGARGHLYHRQLALPALIDLLDLQRSRPGLRLLDIGCGPGVPARQLSSWGVRYTGIDTSPRMIAQARRLHGAVGRFLVADANDLQALFEPFSFDAVSFVFSLQDMGQLPAVLLQAARVLRPGGALVAVLTHPCFRVPRASGWGYDPARKVHFRRIDRYLGALNVPSGPPGARTTSFHRPLEDYVNALYTAGLRIEQLRELAPTPAMQRQLSAEAGNPDIPALLALRARKSRYP